MLITSRTIWHFVRRPSH